MYRRAKPSPGGAAGALVALSLVAASGCKDPGPTNEEKQADALGTYVDIVLATYEDSLTGTESLAAAAVSFTAGPSEGAFNPLKLGFHQAHNPFVTAEAFRFYGGPIDAVWGQVNAWRMDPGYIDYTALQASTGIINDPDAYPTIDKDLLVSLNQVESHRDVSTGFHAVEFLIWGEDLFAEKTGVRPATDYTDDPQAGRRKTYLKVATALLVDDLTDLVDAWSEDGSYRGEFLAGGTQPGLAKVLQGLSTLTEVELAARLLDQGLDWEPGSKAPPDELAPFSDRTIEDLGEAVTSMQNVYLGHYERVNGEMIDGQGLTALVEPLDAELDEKVRAQLEEVLADIKLIPPPFETAIFLSPESRETVDDVRDGLRKLDVLWSEVGLALKVDVEHGEGEEDTGDTGDTGTGTDDGGTVFLPSTDMG